VSVKVGTTLRLSAGPDLGGDPLDISVLAHRAHLVYDLEGVGPIALDLGAPNIMTAYGRTGGNVVITPECARALLEVLNAWNDGAYE